MDILRRSLAPISQEAWTEIDNFARETFVPILSARKFADVTEPKGFDFACVALGRLDVPGDQDPNGVRYGIHKVQPLVETRVNFSLNQWELDNIMRGAKDIEFVSLADACSKQAMFEENAVYNGFRPGAIDGIHAALEGKRIAMGLDVHECIDAVTEAQARLAFSGIEGPAALVVSPSVWKFMARNTQGGTLRQLLQSQIDGPVIHSQTVNGALLVSLRGGDIELILGQDLSIGYSHHDSKSIALYLTESFTFRVINPEALVGFKVS
jgi:uncharacterized linocin/CFP29 family protein